MGEGNSPPLLTPGAERLIRAALDKRARETDNAPGLHHWLLALVELHGPMVEAMAAGVHAESLARQLRQKLQEGDCGPLLDAEGVRQKSHEHAVARGKPQAVERDVAAVILAAAGYALQEAGPAKSSTETRVETPASGPPSQQYSYQPRAKRPTPSLEQFGRDLTREAADGRLSPVVGRTDEIQFVIETLCRRTKRNPALVGPAGVGKTAIVEGLAMRVVRGDVPEALRGIRLFALQPSVLIAGAGRVGELESRMKDLLAEASQDGVVLFIDEVHSIIGAGGAVGTGDVASLLKPALARGDLACIAATTDGEYRRYIERDTALERRFQPIRVQELTADQALAVVSSHRDELARLRNVQVGDDVLRWLLDFAQQFLRNRYFPDKAVDLLEQCVAYAVTVGKSRVELQDAEAVAHRLVGMPLAIGERLSALRHRLSERALLTEEDTETLLNRLAGALRGVDLHPSRPNAVVLLLEAAAASSDALAEAISQSLFGGEGREVAIDLSRFVHPEDITMLVGAPPGYVGYGEDLPLHRVAQMPWCVVRLEQVHACHSRVREVITQALADGFITDASGKRVYLSDAVVVMTADIPLEEARTIGFRAKDALPSSSPRRVAEKTLGAEFVAQCDLVCADSPATDAARRRWIEHTVLSGVTERYQKHGLSLRWDPSLVDWFLQELEGHPRRQDVDRLIDQRVSPHLLPFMPTIGPGEARTVIVRVKDGIIQVERA